MDVHVLPDLIIPAGELQWRFSRSPGPGGQHVNTSDTRAELSWNMASSTALTRTQRERLLTRLGDRLSGGTITVAASEHRSQLRNRQAAAARLAALLRSALAPPPRRRRPTRPTAASVRRHEDAKRRRSQTKRLRRRPRPE